MPARDTRLGSGRTAAVPATGRRRYDRRPGTSGSPAGRTRPAEGQRGRRPAGVPPSGDGLVIGAVPAVARLAGLLLLLAGLAGAAAPFPTYLVVGGRAIAMAGGAGSALVALLLPVANLGVGASLVRGAVPKLGLAFAAVGAVIAVGPLLIEVYRGRASTARPAVEVLAGQRVLTSSITIGAGWVLGVAALVLTVLAGCVAAAAWGRTVMEDGGALDAVRGPLAGAAALLGVLTVLCLALPAADVPDRIVTDPATGMQTVVTQEGPQALLERPGLALLGGLLLAGAVVLCSVIAPSLRPRLAAVGGLLAIAVAVLTAGLDGLRDALGGAGLEWTVPGAGLLLGGVGYALLTVLAWRLRRGAVAHVHS